MPFKILAVRLGEAGGKIKYALLDEMDDDVVFSMEYSFEAKLEIDKNGNAPRIFAIVYKNQQKSSTSEEGGKISKRRTSIKYLHNLVWERHHQHIPSGKKVVHKNGITMDNRINNLMLFPEVDTYTPTDDMIKYEEDTVYWMTLEQMEIDPFGDHIDSNQRINKKYFDANGDLIKPKDSDLFTYYECHYPPCQKLEEELRQFDMCGKCQKVRYCSVHCQERDWHVHQKFCIEKKKSSCVRPPDR